LDAATAEPPGLAAAEPSQDQPLSLFDAIIQRHARKEGFDWRLIAAIISEESRFNPRSRSVRDAYGLMQVREIAARAVGEKSFKTPEDNVRTGVRYLQHLRKMFWKSPLQDRRKLMLAAYHMGPSHVRDAQKLARRRGYDPHRWNGSMEIVLPLLEEPRVYATLAHGYARGKLTVAYVQRVLERFHDYRSRTADTPAADAAQADPGDAALAG
jgi:membrane-bound lytic murein transglycosylase F